MEKPKLDWEARVVVRIVVALFALCIGAAAIHGLWSIWPELRTDVMENPTDAIRNIALTFSAPLAVVALWLAWRRTRETKRQVDAMYKQLERNEAGRYHDRFQGALKMLEVEQENIQLAGITLLDRIRYERPGDYDELVMELFCDLVSEKMKITERDDPIDFYRAEYDSSFNPKVNARICNLLLGDSLVRKDDQHVQLKVSRSRLGHLGDIGQGRPWDGQDWTMRFERCHIESIELLPRKSQRIIFTLCQIDKLEIYYQEPEDEILIDFRLCVFAEITIFGGAQMNLSGSSFNKLYRFYNCRLDNGTAISGSGILNQASAVGGDAQLWGYRHERNPDVDWSE